MSIKFIRITRVNSKALKKLITYGLLANCSYASQYQNETEINNRPVYRFHLLNQNQSEPLQPHIRGRFQGHFRVERANGTVIERNIPLLLELVGPYQERPLIPAGLRPSLKPPEISQQLGESELRLKYSIDYNRARYIWEDTAHPLRLPHHAEWRYEHHDNELHETRARLILKVKLPNNNDYEIKLNEPLEKVIPHTAGAVGELQNDRLYYNGRNQVFMRQTRPQSFTNPLTRRQYTFYHQQMDPKIDTHQDEVIYAQPIPLNNTAARSSINYTGSYGIRGDLPTQYHNTSLVPKKLIYIERDNQGNNRYFIPKVTQELWFNDVGEVGFVIVSYNPKDQNARLNPQAKFEEGISSFPQGLYMRCKENPRDTFYDRNVIRPIEWKNLLDGNASNVKLTLPQNALFFTALSYRIKSSHGTVLDNWGGKTGEDSAALQPDNDPNHANRLWKIIPSSIKGKYRIKSSYGTVLDNCGGKTGEDSAALQPDNDPNHTNRLWEFIPSLPFDDSAQNIKLIRSRNDKHTFYSLPIEFFLIKEGDDNMPDYLSSPTLRFSSSDLKTGSHGEQLSGFKYWERGRQTPGCLSYGPYYKFSTESILRVTFVLDVLSNRGNSSHRSTNPNDEVLWVDIHDNQSREDKNSSHTGINWAKTSFKVSDLPTNSERVYICSNPIPINNMWKNVGHKIESRVYAQGGATLKLYEILWKFENM